MPPTQLVSNIRWRLGRHPVGRFADPALARCPGRRLRGGGRSRPNHFLVVALRTGRRGRWPRAHGPGHLPQTMLSEPESDLGRARAVLEPQCRPLGQPLNALPASLLGRIPIDAAAIIDEAGAFVPSRLATLLFHRPVKTLTG